MKRLARWILGIFPRTWLQRLANVLLPFLDFYFRGNRFTDPINGKSYRSFLPYGYVKIRPNALSPGTLSLERHRLIWLYLQRETDFFKTSAKVLHMAPEKAFMKRLNKLKHLSYTTCDLESPLAEIKADICDLPFADATFDWILSNHVLEHIPNDTKAMQELYRVLKPWGLQSFGCNVSCTGNNNYKLHALRLKASFLEALVFRYTSRGNFVAF